MSSCSPVSTSCRPHSVVVPSGILVEFSICDFLQVGCQILFRWWMISSLCFDFGAMERFIPDESVLNHPVSEKMHEPVSVQEEATILYAAAIMQQHRSRDLPVTNVTGKLIGIVSHVDIGTALIRSWKLKELA